MTGLLALLAFIWFYSASEKFQDLVNGALLAIFVLANSPLITSYWLAKNVMKLDMDHWATQLFVAALGFGLYYPIITILMRLFL